MAFFKDKTGVSPVNCIAVRGTVVFVVEADEIKTAVGQNGKKVKVLKTALGKDVKIVGRGKTMEETIQNFLHPIPVNSSKIVKGTLSILLQDPQDRKKLNGNGRKTLMQLKEVLTIYHKNISSIQLV
jgi:NusA-like KH domain protein|tara:strand:+ start:788 stop:1168 length:381 start_codon:yes stop_codon:yes gene_type:complete